MISSPKIYRGINQVVVRDPTVTSTVGCDLGTNSSEQENVNNCQDICGPPKMNFGNGQSFKFKRRLARS